MPVIPITSNQQLDELLKSPKPVVIGFLASWCGPCQNISPVYDNFSEEMDNLLFVSVDVEDKTFGYEFAQSLGIRAMPTFQVIQSGVKVAETVGADKAKLRAMLSNHSS